MLLGDDIMQTSLYKFYVHGCIIRLPDFAPLLQSKSHIHFEVRHPHCVELKLQNGKSTVKTLCVCVCV